MTEEVKLPIAAGEVEQLRKQLDALTARLAEAEKRPAGDPALAARIEVLEGKLKAAEDAMRSAGKGDLLDAILGR